MAVLGSGGMARAIAAALRDAGFPDTTVVARNPVTGPAVAGEFGFSWRAQVGSLRPDLLVNATPVGMAGGPASQDLPVPDAVVDAARVVLDVVAVPDQTPLIRRARATGATGATVITGTEVLALEAPEQFALYTGVRPTPEQFHAPAAFSRAG